MIFQKTDFTNFFRNKLISRKNVKKNSNIIIFFLFSDDFKYIQRGFGGTKKRPHVETANFRGHHENTKKSKKAEKRSRFQHRHNNQNHHRKNNLGFFGDDMVHFMHNKAHY